MDAKASPALGSLRVTALKVYCVDPALKTKSVGTITHAAIFPKLSHTAVKEPKRPQSFQW